MIYKNKTQSLNANLTKRIQELEETIKLKNEFISHLSHEIRTPLHGISTLSAGLVENWSKLSDDKAYELANQVTTNSQRLLSLVNNILDISKNEHGDVVLKLQNVNLCNLIEEMIEECKNLYLLNKDLNIKFDYTNNIDILVDPDKITQVFRNLLSNAIKVTNSGTITVSTQIDNGIVRVVVSDEGMGVPEKELKTIFDTFSQSSRTKGKVVGIGLGLGICKKIIEAHGGEIWVENNDTKGAKFIFTLPERDISNLVVYQPESDTKTKLFKSTAANILIIDDEEVCLFAAEVISYNTNYKIFTYRSPNEALKWLRQNPGIIDIIMVDMMIPEMSGMEFLRNIKLDSVISNIPVLIQSGIADEINVAEALKNGAVDFIQKPYSQTVFVDIVEKNLKHIIA